MIVAGADMPSGEVVSALLLSLRVSLLAVVLILLPSILLASWLARTRSRLRPLVEIIAMAPLVMPPVVTGFLLLIVMLKLRVGLQFTWWAAVLASSVVGMPLLVRTARAAIEVVDPRLTLAASTLGASKWRILWTITVPLAWKGIVGGVLLAWARSIGEFGATIVVAGNFPGRTRTLPLAIWTAIQTDTPSSNRAMVLIVLTVMLAVLAVGASEIFVRRAAARSQFA